MWKFFLLFSIKYYYIVKCWISKISRSNFVNILFNNSVRARSIVRVYIHDALSARRQIACRVRREQLRRKISLVRHFGEENSRAIEYLRVFDRYFRWINERWNGTTCYLAGALCKWAFVRVFYRIAYAWFENTKYTSKLRKPIHLGKYLFPYYSGTFE